jgi:predicted ATPase
MIKNIQIKNLFRSKNINWDLKDVNVLVGKNGLGKSTILRLINTTLTQEISDNELDLCDRTEIIFEDGSDTFSTSKVRGYPELKKDFEIFFKSEDFERQIDQQIVSILDENLKSFSKKQKELLKKRLITQVLRETESKTDITSYSFKNIEKKINTEFISTINMSANSINRIPTSDGRVANFLDIEIQNELNRLLLNDDNKLKYDLIKSLNNMFRDTEKQVSIFDNTLLIKTNNGKELAYKNLSSGERQIIYTFLKVINATVNNSIILMDEPEISLHLSWQERLLSEIRRVNKDSQIIIVTHSPAIVMNGWMDSFIDIKDIFTE